MGYGFAGKISTPEILRGIMNNLFGAITYRIFLFIGFLIFNFCIGCALQEPRPVVDKGMDNIHPQVILQKEKTIKPPSPPPFSEKLEPVAKGLIKETKLFTLVFDNAPLGGVVSAITKDTDLNLSVESEIDLAKPVTVYLNKVTFKEALDMVVVIGAGYAWKIEDSHLIIKRFVERIIIWIIWIWPEKQRLRLEEICWLPAWQAQV